MGRSGRPVFESDRSVSSDRSHAGAWERSKNNGIYSAHPELSPFPTLDSRLRGNDLLCHAASQSVIPAKAGIQYDLLDELSSYKN